MGIYTRFRDIVASNINSILDHAEGPEKIVRLMIQEMEDTLIEVKSNCAGAMAEQKKVERWLADAHFEADGWQDRAELAVKKGRDDLARQALSEKRRHTQRAESLDAEVLRIKDAVANFQADIAQLEGKLSDARDKQRSIIQRRAAAMAHRQTQVHLRKVDTSEAFAKFEAYENGIDRLEAEGKLVDSFRPDNLHAQFSNLEHEEEIEQELQSMKNNIQSGGSAQ